MRSLMNIPASCPMLGRSPRGEQIANRFSPELTRLTV
jgi:hypothetical protein